MSSTATVPVLEKTIALLEAVGEARQPATVKVLSSTLNIPPATCYRIVRTLLRNNWLQEDAQGQLRIAFSLAHLARSYAGLEERLTMLEQPLEQLARRIGLSAKITIREGFSAVTALRGEPARGNAITSRVGAHFSLAIGSAASVLAAQLDDEQLEQLIRQAPSEAWQRQSRNDFIERVSSVRKSGICWELGVHNPSIYAVSVPLQVAADTTVSLTLVGWPEDFEASQRKTLEKEIRAAAASFREIAMSLGQAA